MVEISGRIWLEALATKAKPFLQAILAISNADSINSFPARVTSNLTYLMSAPLTKRVVSSGIATTASDADLESEWKALLIFSRALRKSKESSWNFSLTPSTVKERLPAWI